MLGLDLGGWIVSLEWMMSSGVNGTCFENLRRKEEKKKKKSGIGRKRRCGHN